MNKQDIVFTEAFKVVKEDFFSKLTHGKDDIRIALGIEMVENEEEQNRKEVKLAKHYIQSTGCTTKMIAQILKDSNDLNTFVHVLRMCVLILKDMETQNEKIKGKLREFLEKLGKESEFGFQLSDGDDREDDE